MFNSNDINYRSAAASLYKMCDDKSSEVLQVQFRDQRVSSDNKI